MNEYDRFETIYESNGIPITLFEIEEWWDNCSHEQRKHFSSPDNGSSARYAISAQIVKEMADKNSKEQLDIIKKFKSHHIDVRNNIADNIYNMLNPVPKHTSINYTPDYYRSPLDDRIGPRPPDLPPIPVDDPTSHYGASSLFQQAMRMAEEKLKQNRTSNTDHSYNSANGRKRSNVPPQEPPKPLKTWRSVFGISEKDHITKEHMIKLFRKKAMTAHPDKGGSKEEMHELIEARNNALKELS